jgi:hypothetical protein
MGGSDIVTEPKKCVQFIYILFITLDDGHIGLSPGLFNQSIDPKEPTLRARMGRRSRTPTCPTPRTKRIGSMSQSRGTEATLVPPTALFGSTRQDRANTPRSSCDPTRLHMSQLFFSRSIILLYYQLFYYNELNHFVRVNATILSHILDIFCSAILLE